MKTETVVVGMSGGVDSAAAAWMLHERGYRVCGVTLRFYCYARSAASPRPCCSDALLRRARRLCAKLGIDHHVVDVEKEFDETVVRDFLDGYRAGRTPNPCILCNEKVKFPALAKAADRLGFDRIATGHYARLVPGGHGAPLLAAALDRKKDQSYFLYRVPVKILRRAIFPLGEAFKESVKSDSARFGPGHEGQKESQDVCFLPDGDLRGFLGERIGFAPGEIVDGRGRVLGRHDGAHLFTIGQRKGLGVAGGIPLYVSAIDTRANRVVLAGREEIFGAQALCGSLRLRSRDLAGGLAAKIRYGRAPAEVARAVRRGPLLEVAFREPQWAVTPGQSLVLYRGDVVVGGGIIEEVT
jgi:tRNA-uridine 2-sulfurtransferase